MALCTYLLMSYLRFVSRTAWSVQRIMRVLQANLFAKNDLMALVRPPPPADKSSPPQMALWA